MMKIHHFGIEVSNIDQSADFYITKLAFQVKKPKTRTEDGHYFYMYLDLKGVELELFENLQKQIKRGKEKSPPSMSPHIGFETDDFEKELDLLQKRGVVFFDGPHIIPGDVKIVTILDPDHYRIDIGQKIS